MVDNLLQCQFQYFTKSHLAAGIQMNIAHIVLSKERRLSMITINKIRVIFNENEMCFSFSKGFQSIVEQTDLPVVLGAQLVISRAGLHDVAFEITLEGHIVN